MVKPAVEYCVFVDIDLQAAGTSQEIAFITIINMSGTFKYNFFQAVTIPEQPLLNTVKLGRKYNFLQFGTSAECFSAYRFYILSEVNCFQIAAPFKGMVSNFFTVSGTKIFLIFSPCT